MCIASARAESNACAEPALNCSSNSSQPADCATAATAAAKYAISLSSQHYTPREYINVKVHSTQCPTLDSLSVRSFTLTASTQQEEEEEGREEEVGVFSRVSNAMFDTHLCRNRKMVLFKSCNPFPLDLPQNYLWSSSDDKLNSICFRLSVQTDSQPHCEVAEACIPVHHSNSSTERDATYQYEASGLGSSDYDYHHHGHQHLDPDIAVTDETPATVKNKCAEDHQNYKRWRVPWLPSCDCHGAYKPLQCWSRSGGDTHCWCSTVTGAEVRGSRKQLLCNDAASFEFKCMQ